MGVIFAFFIRQYLLNDISQMIENGELSKQKVNKFEEETLEVEDNLIHFWIALAEEKCINIESWYMEHPSIINARNAEFLNWTPLHYAANNGNLHVVRFLLSKHVDIDPLDLYSQTPLLLACRNGHHLIIRLLIGNYANINHQDVYLETAMHMAVRGYHFDIVQYLFEMGADNNIKNQIDDTPLYLSLKINKRKKNQIQLLIIEFLRKL